MWEAWQMAKVYHTLPSLIFNIEDPLTAYYFNRAVFIFGSNVETEMQNAEMLAKSDQARIAARKKVLRRFLGDYTNESTDTSQFRDPMKDLNKKGI